MEMLVPVLVLGAVVAVPLGLVILFVMARAKARRARLRGPWTALAQKFGGEYFEGSGFTGSSIHAQRPSHSLSVRMTLVSAMQAASGPYYPDGGTYTEVSVQLHPASPSLFIPPNARVQTFVDHQRIPSLAYLGPHARIFLDQKTARIVLPDAVDDLRFLDAAAHSLEELTRMVLAYGPLPAAAP
jgi:hypothetical protein